MDYTVHGILQARLLEWVAFPFSMGSSQPRNWTQVSHIADGYFTELSWATREAPRAGDMGSAPVWEDSTRHGSTQSMCHNWAHTLEPVNESLRAAVAEAHVPGARAPQ